VEPLPSPPTAADKADAAPEQVAMLR
jgi:hypothetical protein